MVGENEKLTMKSKIDFSRLPPCKGNLIPNISRVNYRLSTYKNADKNILFCPKSYDPNQGWEKNEQGVLEPIWCCGPILPPSLIDLLKETVEEVDNQELEHVDEIDYDEFFADDDDL